MLSVPTSVERLLSEHYPNAALRWNNRLARFELWEKVTRGPRPGDRLITVYRNHDGTTLPLVGSRALEILKRCDVRLWPLEDRMALFDKEDEAAMASKERELSEHRRTIMTEDYNYIFDVPTFFMDPTSMPEWKRKFRPSQERAAKRMGIQL
jgi:hypothetical protein